MPRVSLSLTLGFFRRENSKLEKEINLPTPTRANIFAVPLEDLMGYDGEKDGVPRVIKDSIQYLRETGMCFFPFLFLGRATFDPLIGLEEEGLFRRSPNLTLLNQVTDAYNRGNGGSISRAARLIESPCSRPRCVVGYVQRCKSCCCADQEILARPSDTNLPGEYIPSDTTIPRSERRTGGCLCHHVYSRDNLAGAAEVFVYSVESRFT